MLWIIAKQTNKQTTSWGCWQHPLGIPGVRPMFLKPKLHKESKNGLKTINYRPPSVMFFSKNYFRHQKSSKKSALNFYINIDHNRSYGIVFAYFFLLSDGSSPNNSCLSRYACIHIRKFFTSFLGILSPYAKSFCSGWNIRPCFVHDAFKGLSEPPQHMFFKS